MKIAIGHGISSLVLNDVVKALVDRSQFRRVEAGSLTARGPMGTSSERHEHAEDDADAEQSNGSRCGERHLRTRCAMLLPDSASAGMNALARVCGEIEANVKWWALEDSNL
jgi:hypothetical protein